MKVGEYCRGDPMISPPWPPEQAPRPQGGPCGLTMRRPSFRQDAATDVTEPSLGKREGRSQFHVRSRSPRPVP